MHNDYDTLRGTAPTQEKCRTLRRVLRGLTDKQTAELHRRAEWVAVATDADSKWNRAREAALPVLTEWGKTLRDRLAAAPSEGDEVAGLEYVPAVYNVDEVLGVGSPLTYATELARVNDVMDALIRRDTPPDVVAVLSAWRDAGERLEGDADALQADGARFACWVADQTTDDVALIADPEFPAFSWDEVADALGSLPGSTPPGESTSDDSSTADPAELKGKKPSRCHILAYYAYKYAETRLGRRQKDREAWEYLREHGIDDEKGDAGELAEWRLPSFDTFARNLRTARAYFGERKYTPRNAKALPTGRSIVKADEIEHRHRDK
ncbi:MAG: hypothetical protein RBS80_01935 [Thermoguttaceae bacterium]|jgi:hypothetical protein|nr:hypothetical protein [Thermoguttaceae bacterium]